MTQDFKQQIFDIFGTTDLNELRQIQKRAEAVRLHDLSGKRKGRNDSFNDVQRAKILALKSQGVSIAEISRTFRVTRQTIYNQLEKARSFESNAGYQMRMNFMNRNDLCTAIDIDFRHEQIKIKNYTNQIPLRAFGVNETPAWTDFQQFLSDRCFPKTRDHAKYILRELQVSSYDPLLIVEKTHGYMAGDHQWIVIIKRADHK